MAEHEIGGALVSMADDHAKWSQDTFGSDESRGPAGVLAHLVKEATEAHAEAFDLETCEETGVQVASEALKEELADCLLLLLDASRRSSVSLLALMDAGKSKLELNKKRQWQTPEKDAPIEHVR